MKIMKMMSCTRISILLAMLVAVPAHAVPPEVVSDAQYASAFNTIAADRDFRAHSDQWRQKFPEFDWSTDGCSGPAKLTGFADNFYWPCVQHDFGYRNNRKVHRHNEVTRAFIDAEFLAHLRQLCSHYAWLAKPGCYLAAENFYTAVRAGGRSKF
jgi:hypothetical protein